MATVNKKTKGSGRSATTSGKTVNRAGGEAFALKDRERLVTGVLTSFVNEPKFYGDTTNEIVSTARSMAKKDPEFVAKLAVFARKEFHMRTISQVLVAELAKHVKGQEVVRRAVRGVIERPDDMTNMIAYHLDTWGPRKKDNPIPRSMRRGIADVFPKFDGYQLAKYKGLSNAVKLRDALLIARPKPQSEEQGVLWKALIENELEVPETRETILSSKGQSKETWEEFIDSGKMGYMAMLRNLKNFLTHKISDEHLTKVLARLRDPEAVRRSKQLPFRFFSAYKMVQQESTSTRTTLVLDALEDALTVSFENLPHLPGNTAIICDESGSMTWATTSNKSIVRMIDIGNLLGSAVSKFSDRGVAIPFGQTAKAIHFTKRSSIFDNMHKLGHAGVGHATHLDAAFQVIDRLDTPVDRVIIFSDMQCYGGCGYNDNAQEWVSRYKATKSPKLWVHSIDLAGHGTTKVIGDKINLIAGWSDKVLEYICQVETGGSDLIKKIEAYSI